MTPFEFFLLPGQWAIEWFFGIRLSDFDPFLGICASGLVSFVAWTGAIKVLWAILLRVSGFDDRRRVR